MLYHLLEFNIVFFSSEVKFAQLNVKTALYSLSFDK